MADVSSADLALAGGKGANLGELIHAGFDVPDGFVVTTDAYRAAGSGAVDVPPGVAGAIGDAYAAIGAGPVAVRSSATAEDLPGATFAGQQDTFLNVIGPANVVAAVGRCWASLWTERATAYRDRLGIDPADVAIAVVVQRLVSADHAGVMFTANPVTGERSEVVIDSNPGLGEAVVAGLVTPDHVILDADNRILQQRPGRREVVIDPAGGGGTTSRAGGAAPDLTTDQLVRIADIGRRVAAHFGGPQDIEWAIEDGREWILQTRPMTALPPAPVRLTRVQRLIGPVLLELFPRRPYPLELTAWIRPTIGRHLERLLDGLVGIEVSIDQVCPAVDDVVQAFVPPRPRPTRRTPARLWRAGRHARRWSPDAWRSDPRYEEYRAAVAALDTRDATELSWRDLVAVPEQAARASDLITGIRVDYLPAAGVALAGLRVVLAALGRGDRFGEIIVGAPTVTRTANQILESIADEVRSTPALAAAFSAGEPDELADFVRRDRGAAPLRDRLDDFVAAFGSRETGSILLVREPGWGDSPATVLSLLSVLLQGPDRGDPTAVAGDGVEAVLRHPLVRATRCEARVARLAERAALGVALREDTHFELSRLMPPVRHALEEAGRRLQEAGVLETAAEVWLLTLDELTALDSPASVPTTVDLARSARRRRAAYTELAATPLIATTTLYSPRPAGPDVLVTGVGGGGGRATGCVRVITDQAGFATLRPGEVLVCAATNPSWTPLFQRAAAVVVDHGGLASHAAIVAREYGIPAVMGAAVATSVLVTGQLVDVDGDAGVVRAGTDPDARPPTPAARRAAGRHGRGRGHGPSRNRP